MLDGEFKKERARTVRGLAERANDPFIKGRRNSQFYSRPSGRFTLSLIRPVSLRIRWINRRNPLCDKRDRNGGDHANSARAVRDVYLQAIAVRSRLGNREAETRSFDIGWGGPKEAVVDIGQRSLRNSAAIV
jgi:hypothetical protein